MITNKINDLIENEYPYLENLYIYLHKNPELSFQEKNTSEKLANELESLNITVEKFIGGYGIVGILKNGEGPTIMIRTDMDALPQQEKTNLPYASNVKMINSDGKESYVMHACGHDIHMSIFIGTARILNKIKDYWKGTILFVGQPAEEKISGAAEMLKAGLFTRFPKPNYILALHTHPTLFAGTVGYCEGYSWAADVMLDLIVKGVSGHGASPHTSIDPIVISAHIIIAIQSIISREINPTEKAVITIGSIHGGLTHNIIPSEVKLSITIRAYSQETINHILESIKNKANNIAKAFGLQENLLPEIIQKESTPAVYNDPELTNKLVQSFIKILGKDNIIKLEPEMISEDFGLYGLQEPKIPICIFRLGTLSKKMLEKYNNDINLVPKLHSDKYTPEYEISIKTGVKAMVQSIVDLLNKK